MDTAFYLPRSVQAEKAVRPCTPLSFGPLKVHKARRIRQAKPRQPRIARRARIFIARGKLIWVPHAIHLSL